MRWRKFLETPASGTDSYVAVSTDHNERWPDATLKVADCDRTITLWFNLDKKRIKAARRKVDRLREAIDILDNVIASYEQE